MSDCSLDHASILPPSAVGVPVTIAAQFGVADAELRVELVASHMAGLAFARYQLKIEPIASAAIEDLVVWLGPTVQRYLTDPNA
jgi:Tetracyclin repressor-like, C-terminal domain